MKQQSFKKRGRSQTQEKWVSWFVINSSEPKWYIFVTRRMSRVALPGGKTSYILYFSGQFIGQMRRDMINLIISGEPRPLFLTTTFLTKFPPHLPAEPFIWWEPALVASDQMISSDTAAPFPAESNPSQAFCRVCNIPHISPAVHYFPRGSNTRGNKFGPDFSEGEVERRRRRGWFPPSLRRSRLPRPATRLTLLSIIIL